jgi:hypothetical protein
MCKRYPQFERWQNVFHSKAKIALNDYDHYDSAKIEVDSSSGAAHTLSFKLLNCVR